MAPQRSLDFLLENKLKIVFSTPKNDTTFFSKRSLFPDLWVFSITECVYTQFISKPSMSMLIYPYKQTYTPKHTSQLHCVMYIFS